MKLKKFTKEEIALVTERIAKNYEYAMDEWYYDGKFLRLFLKTSCIGSNFISDVSTALGRVVLVGFDARGLVLSVYC